MRVKLKNIGIAGLVAGLCIGASACAGSDQRYPSLALRPFETSPATVVSAPQPAPQPVPPPAPIRPVIAPAALAVLQDKAAAAHAAFLAQEPAAARIARAAAGQSVETNARAAALVAMADLSSRRGATSAVLADLDLLAVAASTALTPDPALTAAQAEVAALVAREDAGIARIWEALDQ